MTEQRFRHFSEFWPWYLNQHRQPSCRALHYVGTASIFVLIGVACATKYWLLLLLPVVGYAPSWIGHFLIERNRPATFGHPFWAAFADFKMFGLAITGRLKPHLVAAASLDESLIETASTPDFSLARAAVATES